MDRDELWNKYLQYINSKLSNISFNIWFKDSRLVEFNDGNMVIQVPSMYIKQHILDYYEDLIEETINIVSNESYTFEIFTVEELNKSKKDEKTESKEAVIIENNLDLPRYKENNNLKEEYTFDTFVVGESNKFAQAISFEVAQHPGMLYNPLFIYGKSGLGKTHLMHAIGNYIVKNSDKNVLYISSDRFVDDFTSLYKINSDSKEVKFEMEKHFKEKYRNVDVLIIDDIQFLGSASKSQDEFFTIFNELKDGKKQMIISSDRSPDDLKLIEDRLKTRFSCGIKVNITPPDYELRKKIIQNKIAGQEVSRLIKPDVIEYIANNSESDVRHIEGIINRLLFWTTMYHPKEINLEFAQDALKDYIGNSLYITNNIAKIQKAVAEYFDITVDNLKSKKRTANITNARQIAMYLCKMTTEETIERIGLEFNRDHSTVTYACDKIEGEYKTSEELRDIIKKIKEKISN